VKFLKLTTSTVGESEIWINLDNVIDFMSVVTLDGSHLGCEIECLGERLMTVKETVPQIFQAMQAQVPPHESGVDVIDVAAWAKYHKR
jgi:hypothetical protein